MSNHELTEIFYDGLGPQDRYLLDAASVGNFRANMKMTQWNSSRRSRKIATIMWQNHLEEVRCRKMSTRNQQRRGCSSRELTKWRKSRICYWTDSISTTVLKDSPPSHFKRSRRVRIAQDSITSNYIAQ